MLRKKKIWNSEEMQPLAGTPYSTLILLVLPQDKLLHLLNKNKPNKNQAQQVNFFLVQERTQETDNSNNEPAVASRRSSSKSWTEELSNS